MTKDEALDLALEALEESVDLVREDYENAKKLYSNYPSRQARLLGLEDGLSKHEAAITAIKQARSALVQQKPLFADIIAQHPGLTEELKAMDEAFELGYKAGLAAAQPAPVQEPVETADTLFRQFMSEADKAGITHWPTPPAAQRQWTGLTDEEIEDIVEECDGVGWDVAQAIKAKLKEKNNG